MCVFSLVHTRKISSLYIAYLFILVPYLSLSLSLSYSRLNVYTRTQMPRVDVGRVISPESKAPASGVGTLVREFLNPFLHDFLLACPGLRLCPDLACCRLRVVEFLVENELLGLRRNTLLYLHLCAWYERIVG